MKKKIKTTNVILNLLSSEFKRMGIIYVVYANVKRINLLGF